MSLRLGVELKLDISNFRKVRNRKYRLHVFQTQQRFISFRDWIRIRATESQGFPLFRRLLLATFPRLEMGLLRDEGRGFDPRMMTAQPGTYLHGFWASPRYFADYDDQIRKDFTLRVPPDPENALLMREIATSNSVCIHVRRGDYVLVSDVRNLLGTCSSEYYRTGIGIVRNTVNEPRFYVFSDDPEWTRENIQIPTEVTYVTHNLDREYEDLRLMAACRHFIIANSTFSWWAAYLGNAPDKKVIAPERWFTRPNSIEADLIPKEWRRI